MKKIVLTLAACLALAAPLRAAPGDMSVATFLAKAEALKAQGAMALLSPDVSLLKAEGKAAGEAYRARLLKERAAGRPSSCPPQNPGFNSEQFLAFLKSYPAPARPRVTMRQAMADYFIRTYPCR